jgi:hypothetical protein
VYVRAVPTGMREFTLRASTLSVDVRLRRLNRRWLAVADTPHGPSLGWGVTPIDALAMALEPFGPFVGDLLASMPPEYHWAYWRGDR